MTTEPRVSIYPAENKRDVPPLEYETGLEMDVMRCPKCGRFLCYVAVVAGMIRIKCKKCKLWITSEYIPESALDIFENSDKIDSVEEVDRSISET